MLEDLLRGVEGWLPFNEARFLCELAGEATADIVEVGCYRGRSTIALCVGSADNGRSVHSVDPHRSFVDVYGGTYGPIDRENYYRNLLSSGMAQRASLINLTSEQAGRTWESPIGLLYIDGDHSYTAVRRDVEIWTPHVVPGGLLVFHDATDPNIGPFQVIGEVLDRKQYHSIGLVGKMHALRKN
jgi:predicted O-methyltransferase YrrM